jgi:hypothetical protein
MVVYAQVESQQQPAVASMELGQPEQFAPAAVESVVLEPGTNTLPPERSKSIPHSFAYFQETKVGGKFAVSEEVARSLKNLFLRTLFESPQFLALTRRLYAKIDVDQSGELSAVEARVGLALIFVPASFSHRRPLWDSAFGGCCLAVCLLLSPACDISVNLLRLCLISTVTCLLLNLVLFVLKQAITRRAAITSTRTRSRTTRPLPL